MNCRDAIYVAGAQTIKHQKVTFRCRSEVRKQCMSYKSICFMICLLAGTGSSLYSMFPNLTRNDQLPLFSTVYPYSFLATRQKAGLMRFDYEYTQPRFRFSVSGFRQYANRGRDDERNSVNLGDINGRWNMLGLFYDPKLREILYQVLVDQFNQFGGLPSTPPADAQPPGDTCRNNVQLPQFSDPNKEFGFFSVPLLYRKYGVRFEGEILLISECFHALGLMVQGGITDIRQTVINFNDLTGQALGRAYPASKGVTDEENCPKPEPQPPLAIAPPFVNEATDPQPPCPTIACDPTEKKECVLPLQTFKPCCDQTLCITFDAACKKYVIQTIMNQKDLIMKVLGLDICNYHKIGLDDLRLSMYWRHLYVVNEDDERYPRLIFMPFIQAGVGIPLMKEISNNKVFAVPNGNNHHTFVGGRTGFTLDFLDTIDLSFSGGFSYFFSHDYCNLRLPTNPAESGIFPYSADVSIRPGPTWNFNFGMHAYHFLDNLSVWIEYAIVSHARDKITVCRSFIPEGSLYFNTGFDVDRSECLSKWESHLLNVGFNYDLFDCFAAGIGAQIPVSGRNAYRSGTVMASLTFVY